MRDRTDILQADGLLLLTSLIWGLNFVAQRSGMAVIGPFAFTAARFGLGAASLLPLLVLSRRREARREGAASVPGQLARSGKVLWAGLTGTVLFIATNLQQVGMVSTTAGNAGFITCLYVVLVPLFGLATGRTPGLRIWAGALLAVAGLGVLTLRAAGNLNIANAKKVLVSGGAQPRNIFWQVAGQATFGTTSHFEGILLSKTAIHMNTGATMRGRLFAQTAVTLQKSTINRLL